LILCALHESTKAKHRKQQAASTASSEHSQQQAASTASSKHSMSHAPRKHTDS
jgi:hypothetical protein